MSDILPQLLQGRPVGCGRLRVSPRQEAAGPDTQWGVCPGFPTETTRHACTKTGSAPGHHLVPSQPLRPLSNWPRERQGHMGLREQGQEPDGLGSCMLAPSLT